MAATAPAHKCLVVFTALLPRDLVFTLFSAESLITPFFPFTDKLKHKNSPLFLLKYTGQSKEQTSPEKLLKIDEGTVLVSRNNPPES